MRAFVREGLILLSNTPMVVPFPRVQPTPSQIPLVDSQITASPASCQMAKHLKN
jgi:hypothetical protein